MAEDKILGVEDLLGRYRAAGVTESAGSFTLDPKKAMERLAQYRFDVPYFWILKVIQSLHSAGSQKIQIEAGVNTVTLRADAVPSGLGTVHELLTQLLVDDEQVDPSLRHLASGLQGSLAVSPNEIRMTTVSDGEQREYLLKAGGWRDGRVVAAVGKPPAFKLTLSRNFSEKLGAGWFLMTTDIFDLMFGKKGALDKESKVIAERCEFTRCSVKLGRREVPARQFGRPRFKGYDIRSDPEPGRTKPNLLMSWVGDDELVDNWAHPLHNLAEMVSPAEADGFFLNEVSHATLTNRTDVGIVSRCRANGIERACAIGARLDRDAYIQFWEDGVIIEHRKFPLDCPGLKAVVNAKNLSKDVSTFKIKEDDKLRKLLLDVREAGLALRRQILDNLHLIPSPERTRRVLGDAP